MNRPSYCSYRVSDRRSRADGSRTSGFRESIAETPESFVLSIDLPGLRKEELKLEFKDRVLTLTVTPAEPRAFVSEATRSWRVGPDIDAEKLSARLENGLFELTLPKRQAASDEPRTIDIQ
ncbi:Hsp20/alpha crystallin family protein [Luteolibacter sp. LG18]|uniref:Hsp20/alpha crystallin family protein n=1 Tax=Luteolibacter sp. LG18 TaxID=2819286 RepID=UPI002B305ED6|nr:hypothetical protein llg_35350 [Luteolibacter sp. LG18]